jgi:hypothetical protein
MLPFLKPKSVAGLIISHRKPDGSNQADHMEGDENAALEACAEDLIRAIHAKDAKAAAEALKSAFEIADSMPHVEGEHIESKEE